jgi:hypothetical protein
VKKNQYNKKEVQEETPAQEERVQEENAVQC